jgi:branched-chain amino acid transport system substrate-binding protein
LNEGPVARHDTSVLATRTQVARRRRGRLGRWALAAAIMALLAACNQTPADTGTRSFPDQVTIGLLTSSVGVDAAIGADASQGAQLAVDVVNGAYPNLDVPLGPGTGLPHLGGAKLNLATSDIMSTATQTSDAVAGLAQHGAVGLVIGAGAGRAPAAAERTEDLGIPLIDAYTTADPAQPSTLSTYFRLSPTDTSLAQTAMVMLRHQTTADTPPAVAIEIGVSAADAALGTQLRKTATDIGLDVVLILQVSDDPASQAAMAKNMVDYGVGAVFALAATPDEANVLAGAAARAKTHPPLIGLGRGFAALTKPPVGVHTFLRAVSWSADFASRQPLAYAVNALYQRRYGKPMSEAAANSFTATLALAEAIDSAGVADPAQVRRALRHMTISATEVPVPSNGIAFGPDGQNELAAGLVEQSTAGGFKVVFPIELASAKLVWS